MPQIYKQAAEYSGHQENNKNKKTRPAIYHQKNFGRIIKKSNPGGFKE